mmetsp:Transcript_33981/g.70146  ORF Transcript_33981/g.70146 Transcript_33981/m.70146 type:complete len:103 (+) Transcript_33981:41-349(+)
MKPFDQSPMIHNTASRTCRTDEKRSPSSKVLAAWLTCDGSRNFPAKFQWLRVQVSVQAMMLRVLSIQVKPPGERVVEDPVTLTGTSSAADPPAEEYVGSPAW